jgi:hypothetical protein
MEYNKTQRRIIREIAKKPRSPAAVVKILAKNKRDEQEVGSELRDLLVDGILVLDANWKVELSKDLQSSKPR